MNFLLLLIISIYITLMGLLSQKLLFNYMLLIINFLTVLYLLIKNITDHRFITNKMIMDIITENLYYGILSIIMSIHIIYIQYMNGFYERRQGILLNDIKHLIIKTNDLEKQLTDGNLSIHIKKFYIKKLLSEDFKCPICLSNIEEEENIFLTLCGHLFHLECLNQATNFKSECPSCRRSIPDIKTDEIIY